MKSIKKRFKRTLQAIEQSAAALELLCADMALLEAMSMLACRVLQLCGALNVRSTELNKSDFAQLIKQDENLIGLDGLADDDVMSILEGRFSAVWGECNENQLGEFMGQFLEKLEKHHANMLIDIRQLGRLLAEAD